MSLPNDEPCVVCPHRCGAARSIDDLGFCHTSKDFPIASVCIHKGEEPLISGEKGICNIFFSHCNMQCVYCQNYQISRNNTEIYPVRLDEVVQQVVSLLRNGIPAVGFVSPSHVIPQVKEIINAINSLGYDPIYVLNTNGYDRVNTLKSLEEIIDVYLPDFKYADAALGMKLSGVPDYPDKALKAIREMYYQKGSSVTKNEDGLAESGLIIRHLILPGHVENSKACLNLIAEELSTAIHISLMSQYHPVPGLEGFPELNRTITREEYEEVLEEFHRLGFYRGWTQEFESESHYNPDFRQDHPFEWKKGD